MPSTEEQITAWSCFAFAFLPAWAHTGTPRSFPAQELSRLFHMPGALPGFGVTQVQDLAPGLAEPCAVGLSPSIQPVLIPVQSLPALQQVRTPTQLVVLAVVVPH